MTTGGAVKKIRTTASARRLNDDHFRSVSASTLGGVGPDRSLVVMSGTAAQNSTSRFVLRDSSIPFNGSRCSTAVERTPHNREVMGSIPARALGFFLLLPSVMCP